MSKSYLLLYKGFLVSMSIFFLTLALSLPLGLLVYFLKKSRFKLIRIITTVYISIMRGTPLMLQLFLVYFGPYYLFHIKVDNSYRFIAAIIGFVVNYAAYFAEIYRSGFEAIPVGQYESSKMLGFNRFQTLIYIILPQVIRIIIPPVTNEIVTLIKDTSLAFSIGVIEMFTQAKVLSSAKASLMPYMAAGLMYYLFNALVVYVMKKIENRYSSYMVK